MTLDYAALKSTASSFIKLMGRTATLRAIEGGSETQVTCLIANYGARERDGALIAHNDLRALIASNGVAPDPEKHRFVLDGRAHRIITVRTVCPAETVLYYDCQVRA